MAASTRLSSSARWCLGDKVKLECEIIKQKGPVGVGKATATVDGKLAVSAELTFMVRIKLGIEGECRCLTRF